MAYLIAQILLCLLIAFLLGLLGGWLMKSTLVGRRLQQVEREWQDRINRCRADGRKLKTRADALEADLEADRERWAKQRSALEEQAADALESGRRDSERRIAEGDQRITTLEGEIAGLEQRLRDDLGAQESRFASLDKEWKQRYEAALGGSQEELDRRNQRIADLEEDLARQRREGAERIAELEAKLASPDGADADLEALRKEVEILRSGPARTAPPKKDDLQKIHGIGPVLERLLNGLGIRTFRQIAAWDDADVAWAAAKLGAFPDRIERDDWVGGAKREHHKRYGEALE